MAFVKIYAANDIDALCADRISGGTSNDGGYAYVSITAGHDIVDLQAGVIEGSDGGNGTGLDTAVQIQAYNDIKSMMACVIASGEDGVVNIIAGLNADGELSGSFDADGNFIAGSIENLAVGLLMADGGVVNIAAGGSIDDLKICRIVTSDDGQVSVTAGEDITVDVKCVRDWTTTGDGVSFSAGDEVTDVRNSINDDYVSEGQPVEFPDTIVEV